MRCCLLLKLWCTVTVGGAGAALLLPVLLLVLVLVLVRGKPTLHTVLFCAGDAGATEVFTWVASMPGPGYGAIDATDFLRHFRQRWATHGMVGFCTSQAGDEARARARSRGSDCMSRVSNSLWLRELLRNS